MKGRVILGNIDNYKFDYELHIKLCQDGKFFGKGIATLLTNIEKYGSLQRSANEMGLAYSKAWSIIKNAEKALGFPLTQRKIGGVGGGGSSLTDEGKAFLTKFLDFEKAVYNSANDLFKEYFSEYKL